MIEQEFYMAPAYYISLKDVVTLETRHVCLSELDRTLESVSVVV